MTIQEVKDMLREKPGYLKSGPRQLSERLNIPYKRADKAIKEVKLERRMKRRRNGKFKRMFFDIETSPNIVLSWRIGSRINLNTDNIIDERKIICICWKYEGEDNVYSLTWDKNQDDKSMLEAFIEEMVEADEVIGHNGDRYDIPWIRTRAIMQGLKFPPYVKSLDTLQKVRNNGFNFNSNKLDYLAEVLLGERKMETGGFKLWKSIVLDDCDESMAKMVDYCEKDVVLLEKVFHKLHNYIKPSTHVGAHLHDTKESCPGCGDLKATYVKETRTNAGTASHLLQCGGCGRTYKVSNTVYKNMESNGNVQ
jgi:DNA polymerase elongation subunit (family B)